MPKSLRLLWRTTAGLVVCLLVAAGQLSAQTATATGRETTAASVANYALSADMPVDPEVLVGALPNGLRFYIRPNPKPAREAELRLVVKAGSVLEDDDQRGLAHFVEHMQFQGSKHFPGQSIADFLSSLGVSIGEDANAQTSFDDTQYTLRVPDRSSGHPRHGADRARRLGGRRALRSRRHRAAAPDRPRRMAPEPRRQRTDRREDAPRAAGGIALRGPIARLGSRR